MKISDYPLEYIYYLAEYHGSRDYFECHEIMEEYWKEDPQSPYAICWLVLIRIPVALYHARRGNWAGAVKLMTKAAEEADPELFNELGLDGYKLVQQLTETSLNWKTGSERVYADLELPITDQELLQAARQRCRELGYTWGTAGMNVHESIIHRHRTRDRSDVIIARAESAKHKALSRGGIPDTRNRQ